jgi:catechol 2,3-dioxygenase-like lactoylglutathione lyase family enzyme
MIHHVSLGSNAIAKARAFYDPLMSLIGFRVLKALATAAHYAASDIVFGLEMPVDGNPASPGNAVHIAFQAPDRETVRRFHAMALSNGGKDEGAPGIRANYNANYYGAFVRNVDGNRIEAVILPGASACMKVYGWPGCRRANVGFGRKADPRTNFEMLLKSELGISVPLPCSPRPFMVRARIDLFKYCSSQ